MVANFSVKYFMEDFWESRTVNHINADLEIVRRMKEVEAIKIKKIQELYKLLLVQGIFDRERWEVLDDIEELEKQVEKSRQIRFCLERN